MSKLPYVSLLLISLLLMGYGHWLDWQVQLSEAQLEWAFYVSGFLGLLLGRLFRWRSSEPLWQQALWLLLAFIVWRIAFFPIMVLAGFVATWGEVLSIWLADVSSVYSVFLLVIMGMNALALWVAQVVIELILKPKQQLTQRVWTSSMLILFAVFHGVLAVMISFVKPIDWHSIPDTAFIDQKPLPQVALPEINPYSSTLEDEDLNIQERTLFYAAAITYDWIPKSTRWSQIVKGVLEKEFVTTKNVSTSFCSKIHYRAFIVAQPFVKHRSFNEVLNHDN